MAKYALDNVGKLVTKYTFAEVFKEAWINTVKLSTIVNSFRCAGIWPVNANVCKSKVAPATVYHADYENGAGKSDGKLAAQVMESLSSATKEKFEIRYEEGYDVKDDELYNVWIKLKTLTLDDSQETKDSKDVRKLQVDAVDKNHEGKHLKGSSKLNVLTVDDGKDSSNSQHDATVKSGHEKVGEVFKQALLIPKVTCKKTLGGSAKLPAHVSSDEAIAQMEDKVKQKQIAEEEKKKRKEEREMKQLKKQKEKEEKAKKSKKAKKKGTTKKTPSACFVDGENEDEKANESQKKDATKETDLSDDDDVKCPVCCNDDPYEKWACCDIYDTWYHTGCVGISPDECSQLKDMDWFCSECIEY